MSNTTTRQAIIQELEGTQPPQARDEVLNEWVAHVRANRLIISDVPETDQKLCRVRGIRSIAVTAASESVLDEKVTYALRSYAKARLDAGEPLPRWEAPAPPVSDDLAKCFVMKRLKKLLISRAEQWGCRRQKLPGEAVASLMADFDKLLSRHAAHLNSAS